MSVQFTSIFFFFIPTGTRFIHDDSDNSNDNISSLSKENVPQKAAEKEWRLKFQRSPVAFLSAPGGGRVSGVRLELNHLVEVCIEVDRGEILKGFLLGEANSIATSLCGCSSGTSQRQIAYDNDND